MPSSKGIFSKYKNAIEHDLAIMQHANKGVSSDLFFELEELLHVSKNELAERVFHKSLKTFQRYQKEHKLLSPRDGEMALKLLHLLRKGKQIFGSLESFLVWMQKPAYGLGHQRPYELINTFTGIELIEEELIRIEFGALA